MLQSMQGACALCEPLGRLEYVVESRHEGRLETWYVVRPHRGYVPRDRALGLSLTPGCRLVVEAESLRPVGVLESPLPDAPHPAGYNPYFDLPPA